MLELQWFEKYVPCAILCEFTSTVTCQIDYRFELKVWRIYLILKVFNIRQTSHCHESPMMPVFLLKS